MRPSSRPPSRPSPPRPRPTAALRTTFADFKELLKPGITTFVVVMAAAGYVLAADGPIDWLRLLGLMLGTAPLGRRRGGAQPRRSSATHDARMARTAARPIPAGRVSAAVARRSTASLRRARRGRAVQTTNAVTTGLAVLTVVLYVAVYTPLKRVSVWNTLVGAIPGALPALGGAAAATGRADAHGLGALRRPLPVAAAALLRARLDVPRGLPLRPASACCRPAAAASGRSPGSCSSRRCCCSSPASCRPRSARPARSTSAAWACSGRRVHAAGLLVLLRARRHARAAPAARLDRLRARPSSRSSSSTSCCGEPTPPRWPSATSATRTAGRRARRSTA